MEHINGSGEILLSCEDIKISNTINHPMSSQEQSKSTTSCGGTVTGNEDLRKMYGDSSSSNEMSGFHREESFDTLYFKPKRIYKLEQESSSRSTLVRVYSENEKANFDQTTGVRLYDDLKHRAIHGSSNEEGDGSGANGNGITDTDIDSYLKRKKYRRHTITNPNQPEKIETNLLEQELNDECIPGFNFEDLVPKWQNIDEESLHATGIINRDSSDFNISNTHDYKVPLSRYSTWSTDDNLTNSSNVSPTGSMFFASSHAQVEPIPLPNVQSKIHTPLEEGGRFDLLDSGGPNRNSDIGEGQFGSNLQTFKSFSSLAGRRHQSRPDSYDSVSSSLSLMPNNTVSLFAELNMETDEILEVIKKLPKDFMSYPYSQRKKVLLDMVPNKNYKLLMLIIKKFMLTSSKSNASLQRSSVKSTHGSLASQFLNSFSPSMSSMVSINGFRPDDKGMQVLGHTLGKIIGFGAWGIIRECFDIQSGQCRAIKIVRFRNNERVKKQVIQEVSIWKLLKHEKILPLLNWSLDNDYAMYCLTERIHDGTLYDLVISWDEYKRSKISIKERCKITLSLIKQVISALRYLHKNHIVHGDVKLENCLLEKPSRGYYDWKILLCDFGMSCFFGRSNEMAEIQDYHIDQFRNNQFGDYMCNEKTEVKEYNSDEPPTSNDGNKIFSPKSRNTPNCKSILNLTKNIHSTEKVYNSKKIVKNRKFNAHNAPLGISSLPKTYGPSLSSTRYSNSSSPALSHFISPVSRPPTITVGEKDFVSKNSIMASGPDSHSHIGSLPYAAPELLDPSLSSLNPCTDIWALGVLIYTMLIGKLPFKHDYEPRLRAMISSGRYDITPLQAVCDGLMNNEDIRNDRYDHSNHKYVYHELYDAVIGCLSLKQEDRWTIDVIENALEKSLEEYD